VAERGVGLGVGGVDGGEMVGVSHADGEFDEVNHETTEVVRWVWLGAKPIVLAD
jgi:hypothetical protein